MIRTVSSALSVTHRLLSLSPGPLKPCLCVSRKWTVATRWPVPHVNSTSAGCVSAYSAKATRTVTLITHVHPVSTSEWYCFLSLSFFFFFSSQLWTFLSSSLAFQTLPRCGFWWRRCLVEWWGGLIPVQCLAARISIWMHFSSHLSLHLNQHNRATICHHLWFQYDQAFRSKTLNDTFCLKSFDIWHNCIRKATVKRMKGEWSVPAVILFIKVDIEDTYLTTHFMTLKMTSS